MTRRLPGALAALLSLLVAACGSSEQPSAQAGGPAAGPAAGDAATGGDTGADAPGPAAVSFRGDCEARLTRARAMFDDLAQAPGPHSVDTTLVAYNDLGIALYGIQATASLYFNGHPDADVRGEAERCEQQVDELLTQISLSRPVYDALSAIDLSDADAATRFFAEGELRDFRRSGVDRGEQVRERIAALREELTRLGQAFARNIATDVREIELQSADRLAGLPQDFIDARARGEEGPWVITTDYPDSFPVWQYAEDDELRRQLSVEFMNRGYPANEQVLEDIIARRAELAGLLGYEDWADYITEDKMIGSAEAAAEFIDRVATLARPRAAAETAVLLERLRRVDPLASQVGIWQRRYLDNLVRQEQYDVDAKRVREYFAYDRVRDGIIGLVSDLFGVTIERRDGATVWHASVEPYTLREGDRVIGHFYLDMHPREGKFKHAAAFPMVPGISGRQVPEAALLCNFPGGDGSQGLMEHSQVETFLHEFGHLIHFLFAGEHRWVGHTGIATEWDFVEAPSQMLEEWIWDRDTLRTFAVNAAGEVIPDELIERMNAAREFGRGVATMQQLFYASVSLNYYDRDPESFELLPLMQELQARYSPYDYLDGTHFYANFGHLDGYSAIYYTYMWSEVIALDMFSRFRSEGLRNSRTADEYRRRVLAPGGSRPAAELVESFLGRPYSFDAFAARMATGPTASAR